MAESFHSIFSSSRSRRARRRDLARQRRVRLVVFAMETILVLMTIVVVLALIDVAFA